MNDKAPEIFPDLLNVRDTKLHDDLGGGGQRIYTTAGSGYKKVTYRRADLAHLPDDLVERIARAATKYRMTPSTQVMEHLDLFRDILDALEPKP